MLGMLAALILFSVGFPIFNNRIESDLEQRVPAELAEAGFTGITASFSGQDGTLRCDQPLADPEAATEAAYEVWGVRTIALDRLCRVNRAPTIAAGDDDTSATAETSATETGALADTTTIAGQGFATIAEAVLSEPQLAFLGSLLDEVGSMDALDDPSASPVTLFAPTDAAFDALPPDVTAELRSDPDLLARVLGHHVTAGSLRSAELASGPLTMMDGTAAQIEVGSSDAIAIDGATVIGADFVTGNGIVHVVDRVVLPDDVAIGPGEPAAPVAATFDAGRFTLTGVVASEVERAALVDTATVAAGGAGAVVDQLTVDPDTGLSADLTADLAVLMSPMPGSLVSGAAGFDGTGLYLTGVAISEETGTAIAAIATAVGVDAEIEARPDATAADAAELEQELNAFVVDNPIRFEPNSAVLTADGVSVVDQLATLALQFAGVAITVEGHTDTDGDAAANLTLSQLRADAVREALVERGLDAAAVTAEGFGEQQPVVVAGVEDKLASRRVEFRIQTTP